MPGRSSFCALSSSELSGVHSFSSSANSLRSTAGSSQSSLVVWVLLALSRSGGEFQESVTIYPGLLEDTPEAHLRLAASGFGSGSLILFKVLGSVSFCFKHLRVCTCALLSLPRRFLVPSPPFVLVHSVLTIPDQVLLALI